MGYNFHFALASVLFIGLTTVFYFRQKRMRDFQDHMYSVMLLGGLVAVVFDFVSAAVEPAAAGLPVWLLYIMNAAFIIGEQVCLPAFFLYSVSTTERYDRLSRATLALVLIPFAAVIAMLVISPFGSNGLFYINALHIYCPGATHWIMYVASGTYLIGSCVVLALNYRAVARSKRIFILLFVMLILCAMVVQIYFPQLLLATSAAALALTAMYYLLRTPGEQIDPLTSAFNRTTLTGLLRSLSEKKRGCTLVLYSVLNYDDIVRSHGPQLADGLLAALSERLRSSSLSSSVFFMNSAEFTVAVERMLDGEELHALWQSAPNTLTVEQNDIPVKLALSAISHQPGASPEKTLTALDFLSQRAEKERQVGLFIEDSDFREKCSRLARIDNLIESALREGTPVLHTEPVRYIAPLSDETPAMLDISLGLEYPELGGISPDEMLSAVVQSGHIRWYYEKLAALAVKKARETVSSVRFCMPLIPVGLISDSMAASLFDIIAKAGMEPKRIVLRIYERDLSEELPAVYDNIRRLSAFGFGFRLDGFAEGYTDMSILGSLPIDSVAVDGSLLRHTPDSDRALSLLGCVVALLKQTGKEVVCAGVDTAADLAAVRTVGADLFCGAAES